MNFEKLGLSSPLLRAIREQGYETATPIQAQAIPAVLAGGDLMGCAQTGTGKTAAFALPTLHRLSESRNGANQSRNAKKRSANRPIRTLVLTPTRELAVQVAENFQTYGRFTEQRTTVIFGGVNQNPQVRTLQRGVDVLVATPGRLLDLMNQGHVDLRHIEILILDEADQMLDMGFLPDLKKIVAATPKQRQTLMFSATMPEEIRRLASRWLHEPEHVQIAAVSSPVEAVEQSVYFVTKQHKPQLLTHYLESTPWERALVFARTKHGADKIVRQLTRAGIRAAAIHGNKSQNARTRALDQFKSQTPPVLVATDIAARGLDVDSVSHVINYELPEVPEVYVHRIGRTGRAGASGVATSFCASDERGRLTGIERLTRRTIPVEKEQPEYVAASQPAGDTAGRRSQSRSQRPKAAGKKRRPGKQSSSGKQIAGATSGSAEQAPNAATKSENSGRPKRRRRRRTAGNGRNVGI